MTPDENNLLCRVEGDAPMGQIFRRHWLPACMAEEVAEPDGAPVRTRMLGEDLVVVRDSKGRLGVLAEHCPHRRASLAFGRNEECGLRCLYHGWKFDVEGNVLEMASEPADSPMPNRVRHKSYPAREGGGFVWIYMGPPETMRAFEPPAWAPAPDTKISIVKMHTACNWAQVLEGAIDSAHSSTLHSSNMPVAASDGAKAAGMAWPRPSADKSPRLRLQQTSFGFRYAAIRKPILNAETHDYIRTTVFVAPFTVLIPPNDQYKLAQMLFPIDDTNTMFYWVAWHETEGIAQEAWREFCAARTGVDLHSDYRKVRTLANKFQQDRAAMKQGDFTGIEGIPAQDMAMWESMGPITDRGGELLGSSDLAIVYFRRCMVEAARRFLADGTAIGTTEPHIPHSKLASYEGMVAKSQNWTTLGVAPEELALAAREGQPAA